MSADKGSLWPVDLTNDFSQDHPLSILRAQSEHLSKLTEGKLSSWVLTDMASDGSLDIQFGVAAGCKRAEIMLLACPIAGYPVRVVGHNNVSFDSPAAFVDGIRKILADQKIVRMLACLREYAGSFKGAK
jgi:hypothetical protein